MYRHRHVRDRQRGGRHGAQLLSGAFHRHMTAVQNAAYMAYVCIVTPLPCLSLFDKQARRGRSTSHVDSPRAT